VIGQLSFGQSQRSQKAGHGNAGCSLNVVIESAILVPVLLQEAESVVVPEIFKL
jgi:hypothetical protein